MLGAVALGLITEESMRITVGTPLRNFSACPFAVVLTGSVVQRSGGRNPLKI